MKQKKRIVLISLLVLGIISMTGFLLNLNAQNNYNYLIKNHFKDVIKGKNADSVLYKKYFYQNDPRLEYSRSKEAQTFYIDTLFPEIRKRFAKKDYNITVKPIKETAGDSLIEYKGYYEGQDEFIYVAKIFTRDDILIFYVLAIDHKTMNKELGFDCYKKNQIVSTVFEKSIDFEIILWK